MNRLLRNVLAVVAGLAAGVLTVGLVEAVSARVYPLPPGLDFNDRAAMAAAIETLPAGAFVFVLVAWGLGALCAAFVAARLSGRAALGVLMGVLLLAAGVSNMLMIPHPIWMWLAAFVVMPLGTLAGVRLATGRSSAPVTNL